MGRDSRRTRRLYNGPGISTGPRWSCLPETETVALSDKKALLEEQRRLAKLWDAFKKQEDEYRAVEKERDDLWSRVQALEKDQAFVGSAAEARAKITKLTRENEKFRHELEDLGGRLEETHKSFTGEQERLAKLYKVYQDTEARLADAQRSLERWNRWWETRGTDLQPEAAARAAKATGAKLTAKQLAQRKYAAQMRVVRARAEKQKGGKGPIKNRAAAKKLRKKLGIKG